MQFKTIDFSKYSSFKIGGVLDVALLQEDFTDIENYYLIGSCNNTLIGPNPPKLMMLDKQYDYIKIQNNQLKIGGATPSGKIASFCKKNNIANFEFISHLPGKLGGLVYMNAGLKEFEIFNNLIDITTPSGVKNKEDLHFGYRYTTVDEPVLEASFYLEYGFSTRQAALFKAMRMNQPSAPSAGSCFKNPENNYAGRLIESVGLKGKRVGSMEFSTKHANFLVNQGDGNFKDAITLINEAQKRVFDTFGIKLELEIIILDTQTQTLF